MKRSANRRLTDQSPSTVTQEEGASRKLEGKTSLNNKRKMREERRLGKGKKGMVTHGQQTTDLKEHEDNEEPNAV